MAYNSPTITNDLLLRWHARHFPTAPTPELMDIDHNEPAPAPTDQEMQEDHEEIAADHENFAPTVRGLGYYLNGVERTVTDEEFTLFRNSEIRQILEQRRKEREEQAERDWRETQDKLADRLGDFQDVRLREARERSAREREACEREVRVEKAVERDLHRIERLELEADENHDPLGDAPMELGGDSDGEGESEELGHIFKKWSTTSARTKKKNKANRAKYRLKRKLAAMEASRVEKEENERKAAQEAARKKRAEIAQWSARGQATGLDAIEDNSRDLLDLY